MPVRIKQFRPLEVSLRIVSLLFMLLLLVVPKTLARFLLQARLPYCVLPISFPVLSFARPAAVLRVLTSHFLFFILHACRYRLSALCPLLLPLFVVVPSQPFLQYPVPSTPITVTVTILQAHTQFYLLTCLLPPLCNHLLCISAPLRHIYITNCGRDK